MRLHGRFGNAFFDKFRIGQLNDNGADIGIENAKVTWASELAGVSPERIKNALLSPYEYAPSCDMFKANCRTTPNEHKDFLALSKPVISDEQRAANLRKLEAITAQLKPKTDYRKWAKDIMRDVGQGMKYPDIAVRFAKEALSVE